jgi:hypothetical protein
MHRDSTFVETTVVLPREIWAEVHRLAVREGVRVQTVMERLLRIGLETTAKKAPSP